MIKLKWLFQQVAASKAGLFEDAGQENKNMNEQDFELLLESVKQAGEIKRGQRPPSRVFEFNPLDVKAIRAKLQQPLTHLRCTDTA